ncbi:MAG: DUF2309 domain-containing protein, partial [Desulfocapsaceae bacterium]|nr:DUF2309 domain-containing protein [Desulfocapsaceae bacterium]
MNVTIENNIETFKDLHELIERSSGVIAHYWPMTGFVHHNPLHDLISFHFHDAIRISKHFTGGDGYLPNEFYRGFVKSGRITSKQLDDAIKAIAEDVEVEISGQKISHFDVLRAHMLNGITPPSYDTAEATVDRADNSTQIRAMAERITPKVEEQDETQAIGKNMTLIRWCDNSLHKRLEWTMNREVIKWCEAFLDEGHAVWPMPRREQGFYTSWKSLAAKEWSPCGIKDSRRKIAALPDSPEEAILCHLDALTIPAELRQEYLSLVLTSLYGWASYINWRAHQDFELKSLEWQVHYPIDLVQYLAVRLYYERELVEQTCRAELGIAGTHEAIVSYVRENQKGVVADPLKAARLASAYQLFLLAPALGLSTTTLEQAEPGKLDQLAQWLNDFPESEHGPVWLNAYEAGYLEDMVGKLRSSALKMKEDNEEATRPDVQAIFCIDVRSEPFRRNLESVGNFETFGYGGFLDTPLRAQAVGHHHITNQNPGIVKPGNTIHEVVRESHKSEEARYKKGKGFLKTIKKMQHDMKSHVLTPYVKVEALGWLFGIPLIGRTLFPAFYTKWRKRIHDKIVPPMNTRMDIERGDIEGVGLTIEEQKTQVESVLRAMGLTSNKVSRLVAFVGHVSSSDNNPYESAIDCGACWGQSSGPNVRLFATMANKPEVREYMAESGIEIPEDTHFIAGIHNTTTDEISFFDLDDIPDTHKGDLEVFKKGCLEATVRAAHERCLRLPGSNNNPSPEQAVKDVKRRAGDWSETRPEWGLSMNATYIIGSRELTRDINLEGRSFLNSHDYRLDFTGAKLERIMNGPLAVGQWINGEHYFTATDPEVYGSGSKIYHNVVGRIAVMSGPQSDLRTGLAWQTV